MFNKSLFLREIERIIKRNNNIKIYGSLFPGSSYSFYERLQTKKKGLVNHFRGQFINQYVILRVLGIYIFLEKEFSMHHK